MKQKPHPLCVALLALVLCNTPLLAEDFTVDGIYYKITSSTDKTVEVTYRGSNEYSYSNEYSGAVTIPESVTYSGSTYSVTSIRNYAFSGCDGLTSVEIPNSVTSIGWEAFWGCSSLTSVVIPNSVTSIGSSAFRACSSLTSVEIPNSVTRIGEETFWGCYSLTSVVIGNSVTSIGSSAFRECSSLTSVEIPNSVTNIEDYAFLYCSSLTSVVIPNSVTNIGNYAFSGCSSLTSVVIPNSVISIGNYAFYGCSNLRVVLNNSNLTFTKGSGNYGYIAYDAYVVCNGYEQVDDFIFTEEDHANYLRAYIGNATELVLPTNYKGGNYGIGDYAFECCSSLTSVEIPNSVTSIGYAAFCGCPSLTSIVVAEDNAIYDSRDNCNAIIETKTNTLIAGCSETTIPNSVTSIGDYAFEDCSSLTSVEIPNSVTYIGRYAFEGCSSLTSVEIPNSVTSIGVWAFSSCSSLTSVVIPNSVTSIGGFAFRYCDRLTTATVGCSWITNRLYYFDANVTVNATLHSYENGVCTVCGKEDTTGIDGITSNVHQRSATFDLHGRRVNNAGKGLYIVNGKKVIMK